MTTIAYKDGILAADSQVSAGNRICNNDFHKVQRIDSPDYGSVYIAAAGTLSHILEMFDFVETLFAGEEPEAIKFASDQFQVVMLREDGTLLEGILTEASTNILWIECENPWSIGSGSDFAMGAMFAGMSAEEAVSLASRLDVYTNDNVKVYKAVDLSYKHLLKQQRDLIDAQISEMEADEQAEAFIESELDGCDEFDVEGSVECSEDTSGHEYQLGSGLNNRCVSCTCNNKHKFKVGDHVRVISNACGGKDEIGHEDYITDIDEESHCLQSGWYYETEELELVEDGA
jgi:ATP-dependent protease HslVU (ClpYQ) peptidase subunit